jgi:sec-independent protein translocase protein TatA
MFGNIGFPELLVILVIALLVFGPKKLPEVGQSLGRAIREFRKATDGIKNKIEEEISASEIKTVKDDIQSIKTDIQGVKENFTGDLVKQDGEQEKKAS